MKIGRNDIDELIEIFAASGLGAMEYEEPEYRLRLEKGGSMQDDAAQINAVQSSRMMQSNKVVVDTAGEQADGTDESSAAKDDVTEVTSPIVGVFYEAPAPGEAPFVEENGTAHAGDVLCVIEAMKLMNEIKATYDCIIKKKNVSDGEMVEFGTVLFEIERI